MHSYPKNLTEGVIIHKNENSVRRLLNRFFGIGICKRCGYEHPSILGYCEYCLELAHDLGVKLYLISSETYQIRRNGKTIQRRSTNVPF